MRVLIVGCGYAGLVLGSRLAVAGHEVTGMRRSIEAEEELRSRGIHPLRADVGKLESLERIDPSFETVVNLVSSSRGSIEEYRAAYLEGTRVLLRWLQRGPPAKYLYTSSTSVYGQNDGSWVTEESAAKPESATSQILVETERELLQSHARTGFPAMVLRVGGIYGPGRGHLFKQYLRGEAVMRPEAWLNMIHVEDVAGAVMHLMERGKAGEIYNLVDNQPVSQREFFEWFASRLGKPLPNVASPDVHRKRGVTNKRVSNAKLRESGYRFLYPTFREGYASELAALD